MRIWPFILILGITLLTCDNFEYSPYQVNPKYKNLNQKSIAKIVDRGTDTLRIAVIGDSQRFYDATNKVISNINKIDDIDFVIHTGDIVDFGIEKEYRWMHELLSELNSPYIPVVGNHDMIANGDEVYKAMYGPFNFTFTFKGNKFIYVNTNSREFGFKPDVPNISWLDQELSDTANYDNAIVVKHVAPNHVDFNTSLETDYVSTINKYNKTLLCINGHNHAFGYNDLYGDNIYYLNSHSTTNEKFVLLKIWDNQYSIEELP